MLRSIEACLSELRAEVGIGTLLVRNLTLVAVKLKLAQLVEYALRVCGVRLDDVTDAIGEGCTVGAVLGKDSSGLVGRGKAVLATTVGKLGLKSVEALSHCGLGREGLLHVCNLTGVRALLDAREALKHIGVHAVEAVAEGHLDVTAAVAELGGEVLGLLLDALDGGLNHLVAETAVNLVCVVEPRVKLIAANTTSAATITTIATVAVEATEQDEQQQNPSLLP